MADTYLSLLYDLMLSSPRTGVSMFVRAVEEQRVTREEAIELVGTVGSQALANKTTTLAEDFLWGISPKRWRELLGGTGIEGLSIDGMPATRALMAQVEKEPQGRATRTQTRWFDQLEAPVLPKPGETPAQLAEKALKMRLPTSSAFPREKNVWEQTTPDGSPVALQIETQEEWQAFLAAGHDPWMGVPTKDGTTPLILALIGKQGNTGLLLRELRETAMTTIAANGHPQGRKWAAAYLKRQLKGSSKMTPGYWMMALEAAGPGLVVSRKLWEAPAQKLLDGAWFDALAKRPHWLEAIGPDALNRAQVEFYIRNMETNYAINTKASPVLAVRGLADWLKDKPLPEGRAWVLEAAFPFIERKHLKPLQSAFLNAQGWWGPDPEATERQLFLKLAEHTKESKGRWKVRFQAFELMANRPEPGPWLRLAQAMASTLTSSNANQTLDTGLLFEEGRRLVAQDKEAKAALMVMGKALSVPARKSLHAVMKAWELEQQWVEEPKRPRRSARL